MSAARTRCRLICFKLRYTASTKAVARAVARIVIFGRPGRFHLVERHAALQHVGDAIANDGDHVAILNHVGFVADAAVTGNDQRAAFLQGRRHGEIDNAIQRVDNALNAAAAIEIDDRVAGGDENVAGADDVGAAKEDQAVAIGVRRGLMEQDDGLIVEVQVFLLAAVDIGGQSAEGSGRLAPSALMRSSTRW